MVWLKSTTTTSPTTITTLPDVTIVTPDGSVSLHCLAMLAAVPDSVTLLCDACVNNHEHITIVVQDVSKHSVEEAVRQAYQTGKGHLLAQVLGLDGDYDEDMEIFDMTSDSEECFSDEVTEEENLLTDEYVEDESSLTFDFTEGKTFFTTQLTGKEPYFANDLKEEEFSLTNEIKEEELHSTNEESSLSISSIHSTSDEVNKIHSHVSVESESIDWNELLEEKFLIDDKSSEECLTDNSTVKLNAPSNSMILNETCDDEKTKFEERSNLMNTEQTPSKVLEKTHLIDKHESIKRRRGRPRKNMNRPTTETTIGRASIQSDNLSIKNTNFEKLKTYSNKRKLSQNMSNPPSLAFNLIQMKNVKSQETQPPSQLIDCENPRILHKLKNAEHFIENYTF